MEEGKTIYKVEISYDDEIDHQKISLERNNYEDSVTWIDILLTAADACRGMGYVIPEKLFDDIYSYKKEN